MAALHQESLSQTPCVISFRQDAIRQHDKVEREHIEDSIERPGKRKRDERR